MGDAGDTWGKARTLYHSVSLGHARSDIIARCWQDKPPGARTSVIRARHFFIEGRVQGVGFRFFARGAAAREGLRGFVRNLPDGRVEAQAEGDQAGLDRFERALHQGPPGADVVSITVSDLPPIGQTPLFQIRV